MGVHLLSSSSKRKSPIPRTPSSAGSLASAGPLAAMDPALRGHPAEKTSMAAHTVRDRGPCHFPSHGSTDPRTPQAPVRQSDIWGGRKIQHLLRSRSVHRGRAQSRYDPPHPRSPRLHRYARATPARDHAGPPLPIPPQPSMLGYGRSVGGAVPGPGSGGHSPPDTSAARRCSSDV